MESNNIFTGKTVEEAVESGLISLGITRDEAEITIIDEGKKGIFGLGGTKAKVKVEKRATDGERAAKFIDGLFEILKINAFSEIVSDGEKVEINVQTANSHQVIGHHGEVLDAIQTIAGAVANIGNEQYKKVVVDCENYRESRCKTLTALAEKLAKKAVEKGRKYKLEPMNPYERRIIHSALAGREDVKTISEGDEPNRYVVIIPANLKPYERRPRNDRKYGDRREKGGRGERRYSDRRGGRDRGERSSAPRSARPARAKREIRFGTFLGNSGAGKTEETTPVTPESTEE
ncbi:MAG TPA: protein jag [Candidatus Coproplasma excrementipullorum]|nr:protein jag [Candidatus Coproplasma excrementipullorum]